MNLFDDPLQFLLLCILGILVVCFSLRKPLWGLMMLLLALPTYLLRDSIGGAPFNALDVMIGCTSIGIGCRHGFRFSLHGWRWVWWLFLLSGVCGVLVSPHFLDALGQFKSVILEPAIVFALIINVARTKKDQQLLVITLVLSGTILALVTIIQYFWGIGIPEPWHAWSVRRATAWFGYPNAVGLYLAPIFALAIGSAVWWFKPKKTYWWLCVITGLLIPGAMLAAHTEGALAAVVATGLFFGLWSKWRWWWVGTAVGVVLMALAIPSTREIILFQDVSGDVRLALWTGTWRLLTARPLFGSGLAGFQHWYDQYRLPSHVELLVYSHNIFLDFWLQLTALGLGVWIWLEIRFFMALRPLRKVKDYPVLIVYAGAMVAILTYGLVDVPYFKNDLAVVFWSIIGLMVVGHREWTKGQKNARLN